MLVQKTSAYRPSWSFYLLAAILFLVLLVAAQSLSFPPRLFDAGAQSTIVVHADLVVLPVSVTDSNGKFVSGLKVHDFRLSENKRLQKVTLFVQEDTPVTVGLIVDHSRSMRSKLPGVISAVSSFARSSNPEDEMFVVDFNDTVSLELPGGKPFTNDVSELEGALSAVSARGQTTLYDAIVEGLNHLRLGHRDKKALIIVSDGGDNASHHRYADVLALARKSQAVIYAIGLIDSSTAQEQDPRVLQRLCNDTGGIAFFPKPNESVASISAKIARDLREQYTLGFAPEKTNAASFRKIQVEVSAPGRGKLRVRTRAGYLGAAQRQSATPTEKGAS
ncbi:MAG TPA: VWA domain-containing protein [Candidatus Dormibacteraeota bacterium]|nr:VWA domain-containing protein [Candidatus Dormibacteraeota bacterium]